MHLRAIAIGTYSGGVEQLCGRDAVAFSPTGRFLVFTDSELLPYSLVPRSRSFLTLDTRCSPPSWGERDATLFVVENRKALVVLDFGNDGTTARFADRANVVVPARRGRHGHIALHGVTLTVFETIVPGLTFVDPDRALNAVSRIGRLREMLKRD